MEVLLVGAGVIGTVYGAQLSGAGHTVSLVHHGHRSDQVAAMGFVAEPKAQISVGSIPPTLVVDVGAAFYDLVLICVRAENLATTCDALGRLQGRRRFFSSATTRLAAAGRHRTCRVHHTLVFRDRRCLDRSATRMFR